MDGQQTQPGIAFEIEGHVATLTITQERRLNAMTLGMWEALPRLLRRADETPGVRVVVLRGSGDRAFCAGADISEFATLRSSPADVEHYEEAVQAALTALREHPTPTVAAIRGICFGGGLELALSCDLRLAEEGSRFRMPGAVLGLGYAYEGVALVAQRIGPDNAADILYTAREVAASEARAMGFVNRLADAGAFDAALAELAGSIARNAPLTHRATKRALLELSRAPEPRDREMVERAVAACFASADYAEGRRAFAERRIPDFRADAEAARKSFNDPLGDEVSP